MRQEATLLYKVQTFFIHHSQRNKRHDPWNGFQPIQDSTDPSFRLHFYLGETRFPIATNKRIFKDGVKRTVEYHEVVKWKEIIELIADKLLGETLESKVMVATRRKDQKEGTDVPHQSARRRIFPLSCDLARPSPVFRLSRRKYAKPCAAKSLDA